MEKQWEELSAKYQYEGAAAILHNSNGELFFLVSKHHAEMPGGKPEIEDGGDPRRTAIREFQEETGVLLEDDELALTGMQTFGGKTGFPSIQYLARKKTPLVITKIEDQFLFPCWSKVYYTSAATWLIKADEKWIPIRKFNTFFLVQHEEQLKEFIVYL